MFVFFSLSGPSFPVYCQLFIITGVLADLFPIGAFTISSLSGDAQDSSFFQCHVERSSELMSPRRYSWALKMGVALHVETSADIYQSIRHEISEDMQISLMPR